MSGNRSKISWRTISISLGAVVAVVFIMFVWPTAYRPIAVDLSAWPKSDAPFDVTPLAARQNRFTGRAEVLFFRLGWLDADWRSRAVSATPGDSLAALARQYGKKP